MTDDWSYRRVLRSRGLAVLLLGETLSQVGDGMVITALPLAALRVHSEVPAPTAIALVEAAPYTLSLMLSFMVGLTRIRIGHRMVLVADSAMRLVTFGVLGLAMLAGTLNLWTMVVVLLFGSSLRMIAASSSRIAATSMVPEQGRFTVNALISTSSNLAVYALGPVVGGVVATLSSPGYAMLIDGASFAFLLVAVSLTVPRLPRTTAGTTVRASGLHILRRLPVAARLLVITFCFNLFYMPIEVALPLFVRGDLGGTGTALGTIWSAFGAGTILGAFVTNPLRRFDQRRLVVLIIAGWGVAALLLAFSPTVALAAGAFALGGVIYAPFNAIAYTFVQSMLSQDEQQPVITLWTSGSVIAAPLGLALGGVIVNLAGSMGGLLVSAVLTIALVPLAALGLRQRTAEVSADLRP